MSLGSWGRFLVMMGGASVVVVAVLVVACFVGPGCWGFEYLRKEEKKKKQKAIEKIQAKASISSKPKSIHHWLGSNDYVVYDTSLRDFETKITSITETPSLYSKERVFNLKCAPLLVAPNLYSTSKTSTPKLEVKLFYCGLDEEDAEGRLTVHIISSTFLPCREYVSSLDPFVTLEILNNKWSLQKNERIVHVVRTKVIRNSTNPTFDETFFFDAKRIEMKNWCLKFTIFDDDSLTRVTPLFERRIHLRELKDLTERDRIPHSFEMQEVNGNMGSLFFGITYLPTAQRLNISFIKASKLKYQTSVQSLTEFYPYVRVIMVNNHGKCIRKKKTPFKPKDDNPIFNYCLVFDLSISNLEQTVFLVLLCTKALDIHDMHAYYGAFIVINLPRRMEMARDIWVRSLLQGDMMMLTGQSSNSDDSSLDGDIEMSLKESKDKVLGAIVLGRNVRCTRARDHWVSVMQNPRKMISVWHDLR